MPSVSMCVAIAKEDNSVVVFDSLGIPQTFSCRENGNPGRICFSNHGVKGVDDFLTPCFDHEGRHGFPDEGCFCGIQTPHTHAHKYNPEKCGDLQSSICRKIKKTGVNETDIGFLASLTLHPSVNKQKDDSSLPMFAISKFLPQECNSAHVAKIFSNIGHSSKENHKKPGHTVTKIQHGDHVDNLVHDAETDNLLLEHPCNSCGDSDFHGVFELTSKRKLESGTEIHFFQEASKPFSLLEALQKTFGFEALGQVFDPESTGRVDAVKSIRRKYKCCLDPTCKANIVRNTRKVIRSNRVNHSNEDYDIPPCDNESTLLAAVPDCCASGVCTYKPPDSHEHECSPMELGTSDTQALNSKESNRCVSKSCVSEEENLKRCISGSCDSEEVNLKCCVSVSSLEAMPHNKNKPKVAESVLSGPHHACVSKSHVGHVSENCASGCGREHAAGHIKENMKKDFDHEAHAPAASDVRSTLHCTGICCSSEVSSLKKLLEPLDGVTKVAVIVPVKNVIVDHNPTVISAVDISKILTRGGFGSTIKRDGGASVITNNTVGCSQFFVGTISSASEVPMIHNLLKPLIGVRNISINVPSKIVNVEHDTTLISAQAICNVLNDGVFGASLTHDANEDVKTPPNEFVHSVIGFTDTSSTNVDSALYAYLDTFNSNEIESFMLHKHARKIELVHNPLTFPAEELCQRLRDDLSLDTFIQEDGAMNTKWEFPEVSSGDKEIPVEEASKYPRPTVLLCGLFWVISLFSYVGGNWDYLKYVSLLAVLFGIPPIALKGFRTLRQCRFDTNVLMFSATVGAVALQEYSEAGAVAFFFSLSEWLEVRATSRARNALSSIVNLRPEKAELVHPSTKEIILVPASVVPVGALVRVKTGEKIPCDGRIVSGRSTVDESSLTGESRPRPIGPKDKVSGGTVNSGMVELMVRTTCASEDSAVSRLIRLVEEAQANRSETEKLVDEFARYYTPVVILVALLMVTIPWAFGNKHGNYWTQIGLILLVIACPCALIISTPVTYVAGLAACAQKGILIKGGAHLETLGMVKRIAFDKTGTLTKGEFALLHLVTLGQQMSKPQILELLGLVEEHAHHPLAQAIVTGVKNEGIKLPKTRSTETTHLPGEGVVATVDDTTDIYVGNRRLFVRLGLWDTLPEETKSKSEEWAAMGGTVGFMSVGGVIVCAYCVADAVRPESARVLEVLQNQMKMEVTMLTGDNLSAANAIGNQLGLKQQQIRGQLLPEDKLELVAEMKFTRSTIPATCLFSYGSTPRIMYCGDGVNDGPALATADIGVAMGAGAALAMETSDATLLDSNLEKLVYCLQLGVRVNQKIRQNVFFSLVTKSIVAGFTFAGHSHLWAAILTDVGSMILVTLNGMTLLPYNNKQKSELDTTQEQEDDDPHVI